MAPTVITGSQIFKHLELFLVESQIVWWTNSELVMFKTLNEMLQKVVQYFVAVVLQLSG